MMQINFESYGEVKSLFSAILASKFSPGDKEDISTLASPQLAQVAWRLRDLLEQLDAEVMKEMKDKLWSQWNDLTPNRREWHQAQQNASHIFEGKWHTWTLEKKEEACKNLLSPFRLDESLLNQFIESVNVE